MSDGSNRRDAIAIERASAADVPAMWAIQQRAFEEEGRRAGTRDIPPLTETPEAIAAHVAGQTALVAKDGGRVVGAVRGVVADAVGVVRALVVEPTHHGHGIGTRLLQALEAGLPGVARIELTTNTQMERNVPFYERHGYRMYALTQHSEIVTLAQMRKDVRAAEARGELRFRPLVAADQDRLWHWLHVALWDPPPAALRPLEVLRQPGVRIYAEDWGRPTDVGVVALVDGDEAGACWTRLLPAGVGLGSIDATTPQLGIALEPAHQHRGYGEPLMREALAAAARAGHGQVSLTVHPENPARRLYERCGFREVERRNGYHLMVARLA